MHYASGPLALSRVTEDEVVLKDLPRPCRQLFQSPPEGMRSAQIQTPGRTWVNESPPMALAFRDDQHLRKSPDEGFYYWFQKIAEAPIIATPKAWWTRAEWYLTLQDSQAEKCPSLRFSACHLIDRSREGHVPGRSE